MAQTLTTASAEPRPMRPELARPPASSGDGETSYLRHLLEKQPACLLRIGRDGMLLACNDAGLSLLGKSELADLLNHGFEEHLAAEHLASWREFVARVWTEDAASLECELVSDEARRHVMLQAVALRNHPDGVESVLVTVRDTTPLRRIEASLEDEQRLQQQLTDTQARLEAATAERQQLAQQVEQSRADLQRASQFFRERDAERARDLDERRKLETALQAERAKAAHKLAEAATRLEGAIVEQQTLTERLDESRAEQQQLAAAIHQRDVAIHERDAERNRAAESTREEQARLQRLVEQQQTALAEQAHQSNARIATLEQELATAHAEQNRAARLLDEHHATGQEAVQAADQYRQRLAQLEADLASAAAEQARLSGLGDELRQQLLHVQADRDLVVAELEQARSRIDTLKDQAGSAEARIHDSESAREAMAAMLQRLDADRQASHAKLQEVEADRAASHVRLQQVESDRDAGYARLRQAESDREVAVAQLTQVATDRDAAAARLRQVEAERDTASARLRDIEAEHGAIASTLQHVEGDREASHARLAAVESERDAALARVSTLEHEHDTTAGHLRALEQEYTSTVDRLRALQQEHEALAARFRDLEAHRDDIAGQLREAESARQALATRLEQAAAEARELHRVQAERDAVAARLEQATAEASGLQQLAEEREKLTARLDGALAHSREIAARLDGALAQKQEIAARLDETVALKQEIAARFDETVAHKQEIAARLDETERMRAGLESRLRDAESARSAAEQHLDQALKDVRTAASGQHERDRVALEALRKAHVAALADRERSDTLSTDLKSQLQQLALDHEQARAQLERALEDARADAVIQHDHDRRALAQNETRLAQALAEQQRLLLLVDHDASERRRLEASQATLRAEIERQVAQDHQRAVAIRDRERAEIIANLQAELALANADQKRLQTLLGRAEADHQRLVAAHAAEKTAAERALGEATFKRSQVVKALADQRVELQQWRDTACALEPLANLGRVAMQLAREMHDLVANLDDRAKFLLSVALLDANYRPEVEALRADAMRAASLARQLSRANTELTSSPETS